MVAKKRTNANADLLWLMDNFIYLQADLAVTADFFEKLVNENLALDNSLSVVIVFEHLEAMEQKLMKFKDRIDVLYDSVKSL